MAIRRPSAPVVAGVLALAGAALTIAGVFSDFYDEGVARSDSTSLLAFDATVAAAMALAGVLLLRSGSKRIVGGVALVVLVPTFVSSYVVDLSKLWKSPFGLSAGVGLYLNEIGFLLAVVGAVIAIVVVVKPSLEGTGWTMARQRTLLVLAAVLGLATAVGFGLNPFGESGAGLSSGFGSPFDATPNFGVGPRELWSSLMSALALAILPALAVAARRRAVAAGLTLGLFAFLLAEGLYRVLQAYVAEFGGKAVEGTWTFLAAGGAVLLVLLGRLRRADEVPAPDRRTAARASSVLPERWMELLRWAAGISAIGASVVLAAALFPRLIFGTPRSASLRDVTEIMAYQVTLAGGVLLGGLLMFTARRWLTGVGALAVIALLLVVERSANFLPSIVFPATDAGGWLTDLGLDLALVAGALAILAGLGAGAIEGDEARPAPSLLVIAAALLGFGTAVGFGMRFASATASFLPESVVSEPFDKLFRQLTPGMRALGSGIFVATLLCVLPVLAVVVRRRSLALGIALGLAVFVVAVGLFRLFLVYDGDFFTVFTNGASNPGIHLRAVEGTWTLLAAGGALVLVLVFRVATSRPSEARLEAP